MDSVEISTLSQLADALDELRRARSLSLKGLADAAAKLPTRGGRRPALPKSTAGDLIKGKSVPGAETVVTFLAACGIHEEEAQRPWLQALERVATQHQRRPPGADRVRDARPRMLGVQTAIQPAQPPENVQSGPGEDELPLYVPRDFDADLRTKLTRAGNQGGFVLLVGDSSVGKTRALFEAVQAVMPDWWLLHPRDAEALQVFAAQPAGRTVVWLDELQDYLDHLPGVPAGQARELIAAGVVLVATCWPAEVRDRVALPENGRPDPYANDRRLLDLADVLYVPAAFSIHERRRAEDLAGTDGRIRVALDTPDAGFTQVMTAGPALIRHWNQAPSYAKAVITAALDARRVGAHAPLTRDYLTHAAPGYLNERDVATAPPDWLEHALAYATRLLHGATAALTPVAADMGTITGYRVADYLHQHALHNRRREHLPETAWHALVRHHHPDDTERLADNAARRGRGHETLTLYQQLADGGDEFAAYRLAKLLPEQGQQQLRARADNGDGLAAIQLAGLLTEQGQVEDAIQLLRAHADNGDKYAAIRLTHLMAEQGQVEDALQFLRALADDGDGLAIIRLPVLLARHGQAQDAIQFLRARADKGDESAAVQLAKLLAEQGQMEQLRVRADNGDEHATDRLVELLAEQGQVEQLRAHADNGHERAGRRLAQLLVEQGQVEQLRARADNRDSSAADRLAQLLAEQGQVEQLRARADNGDSYAAVRLVDLLAKEGQVEQLRIRADNGDEHAADRLAHLLADQGQVEDAIQLLRIRADNGDVRAGHRLAQLLAEQGQVQQLRVRADNGDSYAAVRLADLLAKEGQVEQLEREVAAGTAGAVAALRRVRSRLSSHGG
ncbi:hypothetical protein AB0F15_43965 [Amycolatopsis sp. NPDC026612]|uniref:hypothetical protein n=1 Tax=Amycolatopsis sp. NPDC026612 TaxID=3155466 RepID=UPI0033E819FA